MAQLWHWLSVNIEWIFSGVGVPALLYIFSKTRRASRERETEPLPMPRSAAFTGKVIPSAASSTVPASYAKKIGAKHHYLREEILKIKLREMANFYQLESVSQLESFEKGEEELPVPLLSQLESFFFIRPDYIDTDDKAIFTTFHLCHAAIHELLDAGFRANILCCPEDRDDLFCFIVMDKTEQGFKRIISSDLYGSFMSSGGGRMNIQYLIDEMLDRQIAKSAVSVLKVTAGDWEKLMNHRYYDRAVSHAFGAADWECMDIFHRWYQETVASRKKWQQRLL